MENPIKMDDLEVPLFSETPKWPKIRWVLLLGYFSETSCGLCVFFLGGTKQIDQIQIITFFEWGHFWESNTFSVMAI